MSSPDDEYERTIFVKRAPAAEPPPPAAADIGHYLVIVEGSTPGKRLEVGTDPITIGRDPQQALVFADGELSRRHARVALVNGDVVAEDLGSTNGTFLNGERLAKPVTLKEGDVLRLGSQFLKYERRNRQDIQRAKELDRDLDRANSYVRALLPAPIAAGPVLTDWRFVPSTQLGGDAFGYDWLDPDTFLFYLIDVSGHGVGSAMHSVAVMNVLRQRGLPGVDFTRPADVLFSLNNRFQMDRHNGMFFTMWYGVYRPAARTLVYSSAGHHPSYLVKADRDAAQPLGMPALMIGAIPDSAYDVQETTIPAGAGLYIFSDGVFEIVTKDDQRWALSDFLPLLVEPSVPGVPESERLHQAVRAAARPGPFDDDFSVLVVSFP